MKTRLFGPLLALLGLIATTRAQPVPDLHFHHLTLSDGLSQSINAFISRDSRGFVWISSTEGLNRFDGVKVRVYRADPADPRALFGANIQSRCYEDARGDLWFCTFEAIHRYRRATDDFEHFFIREQGQDIREGYHVFHLDAGGRLWVKNGQKLYLLDTQADHQRTQSDWLHYVGPLEGMRCTALPHPSSGQVTTVFTSMMRAESGLREYHFDGDSLRLVAHWLNGENGQDSANIWELISDGQQGFWLASATGLLHWRPGPQPPERYDHYQGRPLTILRSVVRQSADRLLVASDEGLLAFDTRSRTFVQQYRHDNADPQSLASNSINELYLDAEHNLWVSIWTVGVDFTNLRKHKFNTILVPNASGDPTKPAFVPEILAENAADGSIWCASRMSGLSRLTSAGAVTKYYGRKRLVINALLTLPSGLALANDLYTGACCFHPDEEQARPIRRTDGRPISLHSLLAIPGGPIIGSTLRDLGLVKLVPKGQSFSAEMLHHSLLDTAVWASLYRDRDGRFYFEKDDAGLALLTGEFPQLQEVLTIPLAGEVKCFAENDTVVWVGGEFGLIEIRKKQLGHHFLTAGLPDRTIYGCLVDGRGRLWLSSNRGLIRYDPASGKFRQYTPADGLQALEYNTRSCLRTPDQRLWFGGVRGLNVFHPDSIHDLTIRPQVQITSLYVNDLPYLPDTSFSELHLLTLPYDQKTLSFDFVVLDFSDPAQTRAKYRLMYADGRPYDAAWVDCAPGRGFARYANLRPGRYQFHVQGANSDGIWNTKPRTLSITIRPPFWQTWWFRSIVVAILALLLYAYLLQLKLRRRDLEIREKNLRIEKQEALTQERNRIAGEMHDDLGGGLTSIRMLSERVQDKIDQPDLRVQVDKIARYSQELVQKMGEIIWAMNSNFDTVENLIAYVRRYAVEYLETNYLRPVIREPEIIAAATISGERRRNIYLAVKESLHNIVKHAGATRVTLSFELSADQLVIQVSDDGSGIDPDKLNQFGNGLHNMRKRLLDIGGDLHIVNEDGASLTFIAPIEKIPAT